MNKTTQLVVTSEYLTDALKATSIYLLALFALFAVGYLTAPRYAYTIDSALSASALSG